ncbi:hypothetical protein BHM03_00037732 [Ensete ventricosum]|nr:hypothetical protein BHM03_00037732 [Ensete ventricosum]
MTAPNIETIAASLRSCSLGGSGGGARSPPHLAEASDESTGGITVDLNSEPVLPYQWEQCLDMRVRSPSSSSSSSSALVPLLKCSSPCRQSLIINTPTLPSKCRFGTRPGYQRFDFYIDMMNLFIFLSHKNPIFYIQTGEIYYINWETGVRTTEDPRATAAAASAYSSSYYYSDEDGTSDEYSCSNVGSGDDYEVEDEDDDEGDTADSSTLSSASPPQASSFPAEESSRGGGHILVAAGCKCCFMYFMVPKRTDACPKCGGGLLHLGRNGCV